MLILLKETIKFEKVSNFISSCNFNVSSSEFLNIKLISASSFLTYRSKSKIEGEKNPSKGNKLDKMFHICCV